MTQSGESDRERLEAGMFTAAALAASMDIRFEDALALMVRAYLARKGIDVSALDKSESP